MPESAESRCACWGSSRRPFRGAGCPPPTVRTSTPPARSSRARRRRLPGRSTPRAATGRWSCSRTCPASTGHPYSSCSARIEYGAETGRAVVNFEGPIVFVVVSRYHGGAFVVFSKALNPRMTVLAVEGSFASVIGGAPAAAVVFARDVDKRTAADPAVRDLEAQLAASTDDAANADLRVGLSATRLAVRSDKLGEVAAEFEAVHNIE